MKVSAGRALKILDFDIENRPLSYWIPDRPTSEITSIAWSWVGSSKVECRLLGEDDPWVTLQEFLLAFREADMVTGHYILRHDLGIIQAHLMEYHLPLLEEKLVHDTKVHMVKKKDQPATQEYLAEMLGIKAPKVHMTQSMWRDANRLTPSGLAFTRKRVIGDVRQHKQLRLAMLAAGLLNPPKLWRP